MPVVLISPYYQHYKPPQVSHPKHDPFIEQVKPDLADGQTELDRGERIPWHEVLANLEADAQQRLTERDRSFSTRPDYRGNDYWPMMRMLVIVIGGVNFCALRGLSWM